MEFQVNDGEKVYAGIIIAKTPEGEDITAKQSGILKISKKTICILGDPHSIPINVGTEIYTKEDKFHEPNENHCCI